MPSGWGLAGVAVAVAVAAMIGRSMKMLHQLFGAEEVSLVEALAVQAHINLCTMVAATMAAAQELESL